MARVLGIEVGARVGFGLLDDGKATSGSFEFLVGWYPLGRSCQEWERRMREQILENRPDHIGIAHQFTRRGDTPKNLIPMYWAFGTVIKLAHELGIQAHWVRENEARLLLLGRGNMPHKSAALKAAVSQAIWDRGWVATDHNAADALCIAAAVAEKLAAPDQRHSTAPLFVASARRAPRRRRRAA